MKWEFTQAEFMYAWDRLGLDRFPAPLTVRPDVGSQLEWEALEHQLRQRFPVLEDPDLLPVLRTAADPDTSFVMVGFRRKPLRAYGGIIANIGVSVVQRPGPDPETGGNIVVEVGTPDLVARVFAAVAGQQPAGMVGSLVETWERVQDPGDVTTLVRDEPSAAHRIRNLLSAPRTGHGHIEIRVDRRSTRPFPPRYVSWFDVEGDGRYTYARRYGDFVIAPCAELGRTITGLLER
ncbi:MULTISPECIES: ESX secretion-associated protein EspG [Nocardia]|uniref:ESX secretion-associated protein EspG n=2 Tax=Nocardia TaxID=1817 RepID=A0A2T2Z518_9NOCA|nr:MULTISPECIES: ESX secretion-associated protein EspG [Nocardia]MBF6245001.1 ESX secretion-associated protein EspG [Nocardia elegans]MBF6449903.1 ESX secretion-associated protein EspG [Nocardia elegans]PSR62799.1 ESX secretion-associated protein EspG [Nocardia nova]